MVLSRGAALWLGQSFPLSRLPEEGSFLEMLGDLTLCLAQEWTLSSTLPYLILRTIQIGVDFLIVHVLEEEIKLMVIK